MAGTVAEMLNWDRYPTYEVYVEMMETFAADYPEICELELIGFTTDGRKLLAVKISDNVTEDEAEPEFLYTGMMHGDELVGGMVLLKLIDHLLLNYGSDPQITNLVNGVQIYINPFANPDGTYYGGNNTVADAHGTMAKKLI
jgi:murein tripeptide amidase MpaA